MVVGGGRAEQQQLKRDSCTGQGQGVRVFTLNHMAEHVPERIYIHILDM